MSTAAEEVFAYNVASQSFQCKGHVHENEDRTLSCADLGGTGITLVAVIDGHVRSCCHPACISVAPIVTTSSYRVDI